MSNTGDGCNAVYDQLTEAAQAEAASARAARGTFHPRITSLADIDIGDGRTLEPLPRPDPCDLPIIAVRPDRTVIREDTGEILTFEEYRDALPDLPRHLVITFSSDAWLWALNDHWQGDPRWTWRVMVQRKPRTKMRQHVTYYGFKREGQHRIGKDRAFTNLVIDAGSFVHNPPANLDLIQLGQWIRDFCNTYGLRVRASAAGVAGQLLRHPMFYAEVRRVVPGFINETARSHLPGPHYESYVDAAQQIQAAMYIDQEAAYHYAASRTPLPDANSIHARGHTRADRVYARRGGALYKQEMLTHGLIHAEITVPHLTPLQQKFVPRVMREPGRQSAWLWTNEIPYLEKMGMHIHHLISVWGSADVDRSIVKYAEWAADLGKGNPHLKALLLMPYGALGRRPETIEIHSPGGESELLLAGRWITGTRSREVQSQTFTSNALQLGLIQAHVRTLSLDMARQLSAKDHEVISVYADGIFIRLNDKRQVPMFAPWRLKGENLELHLNASLRVPVRQVVQREYMAVTNDHTVQQERLET